jgi:excisionase family DNA binding protein
MKWMMPAELRDYISPREAADLLGLSPNTIRAWARAGLVRSVTVGSTNWGRRVRVHRGDVLGMVLARVAK